MQHRVLAEAFEDFRERARVLGSCVLQVRIDRIPVCWEASSPGELIRIMGAAAIIALIEPNCWGVTTEHSPLPAKILIHSC